MPDQIFVSRIQFSVPDFNTADLLFHKGLQLNPAGQSTHFSSYWLNDNTILECWTPEPDKKTGLWGRTLELSTSKKTITSFAKMLQENKWQGDITLKHIDHKNNETSLLLQISTPKILTHLAVSSNHWPNQKKYNRKSTSS